ncbi:MAG: 3-dehydroquinate synthase [Gemmatimonadetes bacterium]|nr:3-dehydroquinate synthase [Gemmatimonadota bacterium]
MSPSARVPVELGARSYEVRVGGGAIADALNEALSRLGARRILLLADANVAPLHAPLVRDVLGDALPVTLHELPAGEAAKTFDVVAAACRAGVESGLERGDLVVGLGGGAATDVAGFVASIVLRGVAWVSLPSSLLGMVDAAVGGKTGVNLPAGKNLVGTFWQPVAVGCEPALLRTLPEREFVAGLAEVVKTAWIGDASLLDLVEESAPWSASHQGLTEIIRRSVAVKSRVVAADEREGGVRLLLNFGHTLGHALETEGRGRLLHGEAVALGLVAALHLSVAAERCTPEHLDRLVRLLESLGLPTRDRAFDPDAVLGRVVHDKKRRDGKIRYLLTTGVGSVSVSSDLPAGAARAALEFLRR